MRTIRGGEEDLRFRPSGEFRKNIAKIREDYDFYRTFQHLQLEFMDDYEVLPNGIMKTVFSDGTVMLTNPFGEVREADGEPLKAFEIRFRK